jgi:predicted acetyltransferase
MLASDLSLSKMGPESDLVLRNLFEHYVHDMAEWFDIDTKADGSYSYDTSPIWRNGCEAYLAKLGDSIAGFAIAGPAAEWPGGAGALDVREFFVIRRFRKHGVGSRMAGLLWGRHPGEWLVRVLEVNAPAVLFWRTAISSHSRNCFEEERRMVSGRPWRFFRFVSAPQEALLAASE